MDHSLCPVRLLIAFAIWSTAASASGETSDGSKPPAPVLHDAASLDAIQRDWMLQDYVRITLPDNLAAEREAWRNAHLQSPESRLEPPVLAILTCFVSRHDADVERNMIRQVLFELPENVAARARMQSQLERLIQTNAPGADPRWKQLYLQACEVRRQQRLQPLLNRWTRFVFNKHPHIAHSWKYTEVLSDAHSDRQRHYLPNASISVLEFDGLYGRVQPLIEDEDGILRNPDVSYDGRRLLFAWKKSNRKDDFHLYEMDIATRSIRQLTDGLGFADYEGVYLPDGNILFSSTRCCQTVDCNWVEASNLYLMHGDGTGMRRVGFDQVHTIFPTVTDDGRVLYTRWEYNDRGQIFPQPLFQMNPDGSYQRAFYGVNSWFPTNIIHGRKIPGSSKVLTVVTGHHRPAHGKLAILDPARGREEGHGLQLIAPVRSAEYVRVDRYASDGWQFQYPYPVTEDEFLVTAAMPTADGKLGSFDLFFMDREGHRELLVQGESGAGHLVSRQTEKFGSSKLQVATTERVMENTTPIKCFDKALGCKQILPLASRPKPPARPTLADYRRDTGTFYVQDIYQGPGLAGVAPGTIRELRVVALQYRAAAIGRLHHEGLGGKSEVTTPVAIGNGSWDVKVVLGTARVYSDGSAFFEAPARTPLYFQALDDKGRAVQSMRSWATLMPGEVQSCVGCHEHKNATPSSSMGATLALKAGPEKLTEPVYAGEGFSFPKLVQPILDRHCVQCHDGKPECPLDLTSKPIVVAKTKRRFFQSYLTLTHTRIDCGDSAHPLVNWIDSMSEPTLLPSSHRGSTTSRLLTLLEEGHEKVRLTNSERRTLACWIDLAVPFSGSYREANAWSKQESDFYDRAESKRNRMVRLEERNIRTSMIP